MLGNGKVSFFPFFNDDVHFLLELVAVLYVSHINYGEKTDKFGWLGLSFGGMFFYWRVGFDMGEVE